MTFSGGKIQTSCGVFMCVHIVRDSWRFAWVEDMRWIVDELGWIPFYMDEIGFLESLQNYFV